MGNRAQKIKSILASAAVRALNNTVVGARLAVQDEMGRVFEPGARPYVKRGVRFKKASKDNLHASVYIDATDPGKGGLSPAQILYPQIFGGPRAVKASETRLRSWMGGRWNGKPMMSPDQFIVPGPGVRLDSYGNITAGMMQKILGYIGAYRESGYNKPAENSAYYVVQNVGVFKYGRKGTSIPVLLFVRAPKYKKRLDFRKTVMQYIKDNIKKNYSSAVKGATASGG